MTIDDLFTEINNIAKDGEDSLSLQVKRIEKLNEQLNELNGSILTLQTAKKNLTEAYKKEYAMALKTAKADFNDENDATSDSAKALKEKLIKADTLLKKSLKAKKDIEDKIEALSSGAGDITAESDEGEFETGGCSNGQCGT